MDSFQVQQNRPDKAYMWLEKRLRFYKEPMRMLPKDCDCYLVQVGENTKTLTETEAIEFYERLEDPEKHGFLEQDWKGFDAYVLDFINPFLNHVQIAYTMEEESGQVKEMRIEKKRDRVEATEKKETVCLLTKILSRGGFRVIDKDSESPSIVVFTSSLTSPFEKAVLKLTLPPNETDTGLEIEREIYEYARDNLQFLSPHFLVPYNVGKCSDADILVFRSSGDKQERALYDAWVQLRSTFISEQVSDKTWAKIGKDATALKITVPDYLCFKHPIWKTKLHDVHFLFTPKMEGTNVETFFTHARAKIPTSAVQDLMIQYAQALSVMGVRELMHNDLHFANAFVQVYEKPIVISYRYPKAAILTTYVKLMIFDWDRGYRKGKARNTGLDTFYCASYGQCNRYRPNFDWYTVLSHVVSLSTSVPFPFDATQAKQLLGKLYVPYTKKVQKNHDDGFFGLPCTCIQTNKEGGCERCKPKDLRALKTPWQFFALQFAST